MNKKVKEKIDFMIGKKIYDGIFSAEKNRLVYCMKGVLKEVIVIDDNNYIIKYNCDKKQVFYNVIKIEVVNNLLLFIHKDNSKSFIELCYNQK